MTKQLIYCNAAKASSCALAALCQWFAASIADI
jgi:hypothetical protein